MVVWDVGCVNERIGCRCMSVGKRIDCRAIERGNGMLDENESAQVRELIIGQLFVV